MAICDYEIQKQTQRMADAPNVRGNAMRTRLAGSKMQEMGGDYCCERSGEGLTPRRRRRFRSTRTSVKLFESGPARISSDWPTACTFRS